MSDLIKDTDPKTVERYLTVRGRPVQNEEHKQKRYSFPLSDKQILYFNQMKALAKREKDISLATTDLIYIAIAELFDKVTTTDELLEILYEYNY